METEKNEGYTERAIVFLDKLERLGAQLQTVQENQKLMLAHMLKLQKEGKEDTDEYRELGIKSRQLQNMIDKWRPIYLERLEMVKNVKRKQ